MFSPRIGITIMATFDFPIADISINLRGHTTLPFYSSPKYLAAKTRGEKQWTTPTLLESLDEAGIRYGGVIASFAAADKGRRLDPIAIEEVHEVVAADPSRLFGWIGVNPLTTVETVKQIDYAVNQLGFKGVHVYPHWFGVRIDDRKYWPIYAKCAELDVPITLQVGSPTPNSNLQVVGRPIWLDPVAQDFPELKLIGLHIGSPWVHEMIMLCRNYDNVHILADAHRPSTWEPELLDYIHGVGNHLNMEGHKKVMWGTDWPVQTFKDSLDEVAALNFGEEAARALLGGNAIDLFDLS
jgi:predicted TIM-barrel fold metal-dependent hydrolase